MGFLIFHFSCSVIVLILKFIINHMKKNKLYGKRYDDLMGEEDFGVGEVKGFFMKCFTYFIIPEFIIIYGIYIIYKMKND